MTRTRHVRPLAAALAITTAGVLPGFLMGAVAVQAQRELQIDNTLFGLGLGAFFGAGGLLAIPGGTLADRLGWRSSLRWAGVANLTALLLVAGGIRDATTFVVGLAIAGATLGLTGPVGNLILAREMPSHRLGLVFGIKQAAIPAATTFAGLAVPLVALTVGWRWAFVGAAIFPITALLASRGASPTVTSKASSDVTARPPTRPARGRGLTAFALASGLATTGTGALAGFLVLSSVGLGMAEETAGLLYAGASATGLVVRVAAGWLADRQAARGFAAVAVMMVTGAAGFGLLALQQQSLMLPGALLAFGFGWSWAGLLLYGVVQQHPDRPATATGTVQVGSTAGVAFGPLLFGIVADRANHGTAWLVAGTMLVLASVLVRTGAVRSRPPGGTDE